MTNAELLQTIRQEIERRIRIDCVACVSDFRDLLSFFDTLQVDDVPKDMEEAGKDVIRQAHAHNRKFCIPATHFEDVQLMDIFKAGVYWMAEQEHNRKEVDEPEGLDEAAEEYYKKAKKHLFDNSPIGDCRHAFKAEAAFERERMMKDAVEGEVHHLDNVHYIITDKA